MSHLPPELLASVTTGSIANRISSLVLEFGQLGSFQLSLLPAEQSLVPGVTRARLRELRGGRTAARRALNRLGLSDAAILSGSAGEPTWPPGICGSLSHTSTHVAALVARRGDLRAVGVDVNDGRSLGRRLEDQVLSNAERRVLMPISNRLSIDPGNLAFSAKEAFFKCQYSVTRRTDVSFGEIVLVELWPHGPCVAKLAECSISAELHFAVLDGQLVCCALDRGEV